MLSFCTTVKNRSRVSAGDLRLELFPRCVESIVRAVSDRDDCELVVTDWESEDWPLEEWFYDLATAIPVRVRSLRGSFSRGLGRNKAAKAAGGDTLFFVDADCLVGGGVIDRGLAALEEGHAYFPIVFSYNDARHECGRWRSRGYGNCVIHRRTFESAGGFPEYGFWGREDTHFYENVCKIASVVRERAPDLYHQWHPDDFAWKNRYGGPSPFEATKREEREKYRKTADELMKLGVEAAAIVLVDDLMLDSALIPSGNCRPFLEIGGEYCGRPMDSAAAVIEIERMRREGARLIAFVWSSFWWLEHYSEFARHLSDRYESVLKNERLLVFDLGKS